MDYKGELTPLESSLVECAATGVTLDCATSVQLDSIVEPDLEQIDDWEERKIRAEILVALCTGEVPEWSVHPRGGIGLRGAYIAGQVNLSRAQLSQCPLAFHTCRFEKGIVLEQATTTDLSFTSCALPSLYGAGVNSSASLRLTHTHLRQMSFGNASFRGFVQLSEVRLINPEGRALSADAMSASEMILEDTSVEGEVRLPNANLSGELGCGEGTKLINPGGTALGVQACQVGGTLVFELGEAAVGKVSFASAQIGTLVDDLASWPDTYNLVGFSYRSLGRDENLDQRLGWISKSKPFSPYVYTQLAEVYRRSGHEGFARQVSIEREKERGRQPDLGWGSRAWNSFLGLTVAYGYQPWRALVPLVVLFVLGWFLFTRPPAQEVMVHPSTKKEDPISAEACHKPYPCFSPSVYVLDTLLPIVDLHQERNWVPARPRPWGVWYEVLTWVLIASGWILTTAVVAGIGSLWRRE